MEAGTTLLLIYLGAAVIGYAFGSIPFGLLLTRLAGAGDIRAIGSGNIGATNVLRTGRKGLAFATLLLDGGKGAVAVLAAAALTDQPPSGVAPLIAGVAAVLGHNFPVWLGFKGGKGVATTIGLMLAAASIIGVMAIATWLAVAVVSRMSSLAALAALALSPVYAWVLAPPAVAIAFGILGILGWLRHAANIRRILRGEEPKIGAKNAT